MTKVVSGNCASTVMTDGNICIIQSNFFEFSLSKISIQGSNCTIKSYDNQLRSLGFKFYDLQESSSVLLNKKYFPLLLKNGNQFEMMQNLINPKVLQMDANGCILLLDETRPYKKEQFLNNSDSDVSFSSLQYLCKIEYMGADISESKVIIPICIKKNCFYRNEYEIDDRGGGETSVNLNCGFLAKIESGSSIRGYTVKKFNEKTALYDDLYQEKVYLANGGLGVPLQKGTVVYVHSIDVAKIYSR